MCPGTRMCNKLCFKTIELCIETSGDLSVSFNFGYRYSFIRLILARWSLYLYKLKTSVHRTVT